ncbi:GAF domain-containing protein [Candidatus Poribacteria bacterium]|nr:GAF domain-containing protein [Candidatus Poribacteria bacterium]
MLHRISQIQNEILQAVLSMESAYDLTKTVERTLKEIRQLEVTFETCSIYLKQASENVFHYYLYPSPAGWKELPFNKVRTAFTAFEEQKTMWSGDETRCLNIPTSVGVLTLTRSKARYTEEEIKFWESLANAMMMIATRHQDLLQKEVSQAAIQNLDEDLLALHDASASLFSFSQRDTVEKILYQATQTLGFDRCGVFLKDEASGVLRGELGINQQGKVEDISRTAFPLTPSRPEETTVICQIALGKRPFFLTQDLDGEGYQTEEGDISSHASVPMRVGKKIIGVLCVDNYLYRKPILSSQLPSLMVLANQSANALFHCAEEAAIQKQWTSMVEVSNALSKIDSFDELCRRTVELGRSRLGFDCLGVWFCEEDRDFLSGSFGIDKNGHICDQRGQRRRVDQMEKNVLMLNKSTSIQNIAPLHNANGEPIGTGTHVVASIWDGKEAIGIIRMDNLLSRQPITESECKRLALYASVLGHLCSRQQAVSELQASLQEKKMLLKEIHHRVKNNLQIIASLLDLQSDLLTDPQVLSAFTESQNRIRSMALIHEQLYQSADLMRIDFGKYINDLVYSLFNAYESHSYGIISTIEVDEIPLNVDAAIPCGLILNELVSNCLKHAFPSRHHGEIHITLRPEKDGQLTLIVRDDGTGFPDNLDFRETESLGLQLVCILTDQLKGSITLNRNRGTVFQITFPVEDPIQ